MKDFVFCSPTTFIFGRDTEKQVGDYCQKFKKSKVLIHYGGGSVIRSGLLDRIKGSLDRAQVAWVELGGVKPNPRASLVYEGIKLGRTEQVDLILAVGGGSAIDSSKAIAAGIPYIGDFWDFYEGKALVQNPIAVATVLTIPAAGSEGSPGSVITREDGLLKRAVNDESLRPLFSILNPELTYTLPPFQTACGAADIMSHVFERYLTNTTDVEFSDRLCESVLRTMVQDTPRVLAKPDDYGPRSNIMWAGMVAHNDIVGTDREQDWSSHDIEHELSALYDVAHGAGLAVVFPAFMRFTLQHDVMRFAQLAVRVWNCEMDYEHPERTAAEGIARLTAFYHSIGLPTTFEALGARVEDIPVMAQKLNLTNGRKLGSFNPLTTQDVEAIYHLSRANAAN
ncbi:MAG: iron-containing alcohol dehydrogenase [Eubacteriales bacterium]|nr:iron-containing alcohol dehydrogenase [Eubacteriales bacterium]